MVSVSSIASNVYAAEPQFSGLEGVATDSSGRVYAADENNNRIQKFSNTGTFIRKWGTFGTMSISSMNRSLPIPFG